MKRYDEPSYMRADPYPIQSTRLSETLKDRKIRAERESRENLEAHRELINYAEEVKAKFREERGKAPKANATVDWKKPFIPTIEE